MTRAPITRWAIVTGGASGIGRAIALELARRQWHVAVVDCNLAGAEQVALEITQRGDAAESYALDVAASHEWDALVQNLRSRWPRLDLVVNAAGNLLVGPVAQMDAADIARLVEVNLLGTMYGCCATLPWLVDSAKQGGVCGGGILNIASIFAQVSPPGFASYSATKAAVVAWTEALRGELAPARLAATVVLPGVTPTPLFARAQYPSGEWRQLCEGYLARAELTAVEVAVAALDGIERGSLYVVVGRRAKLYSRLKRLAPAWLIDRVGRLAQRQWQAACSPATPLPHTPAPETR